MPAVILTEDELAMRKSTTLTVIGTEWDRIPEVAVTVTVKDPATVEVTVTVEIPDPRGDRLTLPGFRFAAVLVVVRVTKPVKLLMPVRVRVVLLEEPAATLRDCGLADTVKSRAGPTVIDMLVV